MSSATDHYEQLLGRNCTWMLGGDISATYLQPAINSTATVQLSTDGCKTWTNQIASEPCGTHGSR